MAVRQTVVSDTNSPKTLTFNKLRGVDYSSSQFEVSTSRATSMKNMINEDGVNHKRHGWSEDNIFSKKITELQFDETLGVYDVVLKNTFNESFVPVYVYAGIIGETVKIYVQLKQDDGTIYIPSSFEYTCTLAERTINCFENNGDLYILGCGEYSKLKVIESTIDQYAYEIDFETASSFGYVPTTTKSRNNKYDTENNGAKFQNFDSANVLTPKRKNSFIINEFARQYNIAFSVHELFLKEYKKVVFRFVNNKTNALTEVNATGKEYVVAQLQDGTYKVRIICDDVESSIFTWDEFKPSIANVENSQIKIDDTQYYYLSRMTNNANITINSHVYANPSIEIYSDLASAHYQITTWYQKLNISAGDMQIMEQASVVTGGGYNPDYSYFDNNVYEFDTPVKPYSMAKITIESKYDLSTNSYGNDSIKYEIEIGVGKKYNKIKVTYKGNEYHIGFIHPKHIILMNNNLISTIQGQDNMIVEFESEDDTYTNVVRKCKYGVSYGLTGYNDKLFVFGNDEYPATLYFTGYNDLSYFPFINYNVIGSSVNKISGLSVLSDSTIAVHKENNFKEASIYYLTAQSVALEDKKEVAFSTSVGTIGETPINQNVCSNFASESLILSKNGVFAIKPSQNIKVGERYAVDRSQLINSEIFRLGDISDAKSIVYKNKYYLYINNNVFIADARYKTSAREQDMNDTFNYEWWHWNNVPVKKWIIIDDELCFVGETGKICKFTDEFEDVTLIPLSSGDWTDVANSDNYIHLNEARTYLLKEGNTLIVNGNYYTITNINKYNSSFRLKDSNGNIVNIQGDFYQNFNKSFYICDKANVVSEWNTPLLNMGTSIYSKNLLSSTLTFEPHVEGNVKFGYTTRRTAEPKYKDSNLSVAEGLDFTDLDFTDFSFNVNFACSRTLKTRVRNYNYIQFRVISDDNKDFALNNFVVTYNYGRKNKGVR